MQVDSPNPTKTLRRPPRQLVRENGNETAEHHISEDDFKCNNHLKPPQSDFRRNITKTQGGESDDAVIIRRKLIKLTTDDMTKLIPILHIN